MIRRPSTDPNTRRRALAMLEGGVFCARDIAAMLHVSVDTIAKWAKGQEPKPEKELTPAPYARGYRVGWGKWS